MPDPAYSLPCTFGHADYGGLGGRVGQHAGVAFLAGDGSNVQYPAVILRQHGGQHVPGNQVSAKEVDLKHFTHVLRVCFVALQVGSARNPRAVHQDVDGAEIRTDLPDDPPYLFFVGDVEGVRARCGGQCPGDLPEPGAIQVEQGQFYALGGQPGGNGRAQARSGPGDYGYLVFEVFHKKRVRGNLYLDPESRSFESDSITIRFNTPYVAAQF
jgi:hypothetical protein